MSRKFKFRGITENGQWVYGSLIECGITGKKYIFPSGNDANESDKVGQEGCLKLVAFEVIPETVGQYTKLPDKNGVEIYEGDIVLYTDNFKVNGTTSHISSVERNEELNGFYVKAVGFGYYSVNKQSIERYSVEVIGNIHERSGENE